MAPPLGIGRNSRRFPTHWQGRTIDPNETFDPHTDPRSAFVPVVRDGFGDYSESFTRGFLKDRICACWNLASISPFFPLVHYNRTHFRAFPFRPTFTNLSVENCTILWRVAQKFSMEEASKEVGDALAKAYASYDGETDGKEQSRVEDEAFRILARRVDSTQDAATAPSTALQTTPPTTLQLETAPSTAVQSQLDTTVAPHNVNVIEFAATLGPEPTKDTLRSLTVKSIVDEFSSTNAADHLAQLVTGVEEAISRRDKFIVNQLHEEEAKISKELSELLLEKTRHEKAEEARHGIQKLGSYLDVLNNDGDPLSPFSGARQALNALQEEIKKHGTKRSSDYELESAALRAKQKRIKAQVELLTEKEGTFSASEHLKVYKE